MDAGRGNLIELHILQIEDPVFHHQFLVNRKGQVRIRIRDNLCTPGVASHHSGFHFSSPAGNFQAQGPQATGDEISTVGVQCRCRVRW